MKICYRENHLKLFLVQMYVGMESIGVLEGGGGLSGYRKRDRMNNHTKENKSPSVWFGFICRKASAAWLIQSFIFFLF